MTKEQIYDAEIFPLMEKIQDICKENKIPMLATFALDDGLQCTSAYLEPAWNTPRSMENAFLALYKNNPSAFQMFTVIEPEAS